MLYGHDMKICIVTKGCIGRRKVNTVKFLINIRITVQRENHFMASGE